MPSHVSSKQEARLEAGEFKAELENLKAENARRNFGKQGNSLFGEVCCQFMKLETKARLVTFGTLKFNVLYVVY